MKLVLALFALMLAAAAASFWAWRAAPQPAPCQDNEVSTSPSPDGLSRADVFQRRCGDGVSTHVALRPASKPPAARADVFVAAGSVPVRVDWTAKGDLLIDSPAPRVLLSESSWRSVKIRGHPLRP